MGGGFKDYVRLEDALRLLRDRTRIRPRLEVVRVEESYGRFVGEDVVAPSNIPVADSSRMDGYAVRSRDLELASDVAPAMLKVKNGVPLGRHSKYALKKGEASRILTGGYLPRGADAVLQGETLQKVGRFIFVKSGTEAGSFVFRRGADVTLGALVLRKGQMMRAQDVGIAMSLSIGRLKVFRRPVVGIIPTGDELTAEVHNIEPGRFVDSHTHVLSWLVRAAGGEAMSMGIAKDDTNSIALKLKSALRRSEMVLTIAGSSVGEMDLVEKAVNSAGHPGVVVHGVRIHRGRVTGLGFVAGKPVIMLPGPIQGMLNAYSAFVYPLIRAHLGHGFQEPPVVPARLSEDWEAQGSFTDFWKVLFVKRSVSENGIEARPLVGETEKMTLLTSADGYVLVPETVRAISAGSVVKVHLLPGFSGES
jgi:molybdenum cofactor synthesis domain-containing protein